MINSSQFDCPLEMHGIESPDDFSPPLLTVRQLWLPVFPIEYWSMPTWQTCPNDEMNPSGPRTERAWAELRSPDFLLSREQLFDYILQGKLTQSGTIRRFAAPYLYDARCNVDHPSLIPGNPIYSPFYMEALLA
jgi:hypothetical protein